MKKVKLLKMDIENFKGLRCFSIDFNDDVTNIIGANGTGKTSVHDAYLWMLLGIDSANRAGFAVQPLDASSKTVDHLTTSVSGLFIFDGVRHEIKRSLHQTWTRRRGTKEDVLTGSETEYFIDGVPCKAGEFSKEIATLFCQTDDFKLISSIRAFGQLDMKSKRAKLIQMAGQMPELINDTDYPALAPYYAETKNVDAIKKKLKYEMDGLKAKQSEIPIKITENERNMPTGIDFDALREQLAMKQSEVEKIDAKLQKEADGKNGLFSNVAALNDELKAIADELAEIQTSLSEQRSKRLSEVNEKLTETSLACRDAEGRSAILHRDIDDLQSRIDTLTSRKKELGRLWEEKNKETFPDNIDKVCPTCKRPFDEEDLARARAAAIRAFNAGKTGVLAQIVAEGNEVVKKLSSLNDELADKKATSSKISTELIQMKDAELELKKKLAEVPTLSFLLDNSKEYQTVLARRHEVRTKLSECSDMETPDERQLKNRKEALKQEIASLIAQLAKEKDIEKVEARRKELEDEAAEIATKVARLDEVMYEISQYQKAYIELVESRVSSMFKLVTWKMYSKNVTNDGETEICECLVDGVPVSTNVNTASAVNAGIDIINAMSNWLGISVPLWIDGKESVTKLIETDAQLVTLQVVENSLLKVA